MNHTKLASGNLYKNTRYHSIDFIKGIAILFVVFTHYQWTDEQRLKLLFQFWISMAVPAFMIISGFVYSKSYSKHKINTFEKAYSVKGILNKYLRYTLPFAVTFIIEEILFALTGRNVGIRQFVHDFLIGGVGKGNYYYPIMIQFIFWFPILYFIIKKYDYKGLLICFAINGVYELAQKLYDMSGYTYRLLLFRYTFLIAFGIYLAIGKTKIKKSVYAIGAIISIAYIIVFCYLGVTPLITIHRSGTCFLACLFFCPIAALLINSNIHFAPIELLGKASYNIFLTQMVYYVYAGFMYQRVPMKPLQILINLLVCCVVGVIFYNIETPITKFLIEKASAVIEK